MTWQEAMNYAWGRVERTGWRFRVYAYRDNRTGDILYTAARAGRKR